MRSIKIHINKLGLIRNADVEIKPLMLFSGYSGLGKSYVSILCHYFFIVWMNDKRLHNFFKKIQDSKGISFSESNKSVNKNNASFSVTKVDIENWLATDSIDYLRFMLGFSELTADIKVSLPIEQHDIVFSYDEEMIGIGDVPDIYNKLSALGLSYQFKQLGITDESPYAFVFRYAMIRNLFGDYTNLVSSYVFPPARGMYMSEFPLVSSAKTGLCKTFVNDMNELNAAQEIPDKISHELISLIHEVLAGDVKLEGGQYIYVTHGEVLPISAAAASVREVGSLQQLIMKRDIGKSAILFEEPESHLHPLKQIQMADIIALMAGVGANLQITTHSDYFMRRLNDLIRLHILKEKDEQMYKKICEEYSVPQITLNPSVLSAYYLEQEECGDVKLKLQDVTTGIPFDTFDSANDKPLDLSVMLYELTTNNSDDEEINR